MATLPTRRRFIARLMLLAALGAAPALALAPRFTDADGDLTADPSSDPKDWVDPAVLVFAYTPVEDPAPSTPRRGRAF